MNGCIDVSCRESIYNTFVQRVRDNLHVVLCMSPIGDAFRTRCRKFPSLINCSTIDWFTSWPREALLSVSQRFLKEVSSLFEKKNFMFHIVNSPCKPLQVELPSEEVRQALSEMCVEIHSSVEHASHQFLSELRRHVYTTPKSYLDMINLYLSMLAEKRHEISSVRNRFALGLQKLKEANDMVADLKVRIASISACAILDDMLICMCMCGQITLTKLQPELIKKTAEADVLVRQIAVDQEKANEVTLLNGSSSALTQTAYKSVFQMH